MDPRDNPAQSRFELAVDGGVAVATYQLAPGVMTISHVVVPPPAEGQGVGGRLTAFALDQARARGLKVVPQCPFVAAYFRRHPVLADLLA